MHKGKTVWRKRKDSVCKPRGEAAGKTNPTHIWSEMSSVQNWKEIYFSSMLLSLWSFALVARADDRNWSAEKRSLKVRQSWESRIPGKETDFHGTWLYCWPSDLRSNEFLSLAKDPDAGKDWKQEEKGVTEDEMVTWHEFEQNLGDSEGQRSLAGCSLWGHRVGHDLATEQEQFSC